MHDDKCNGNREYDLHIKNNECEAYKHFSGDRKECFVLNLNGM